MNELYCAYDHIMAFHNICERESYRHLVNHIIISFDGKMKCVIEGQEVECFGIIINSNVLHSLYSNGVPGRFMVFLIDPSSQIAQDISLICLNEKYHILSESIVSNIVSLWMDGEKERKKDLKYSYDTCVSQILKMCSLSRKTNGIEDKRIDNIFACVDALEGIDEEVLDRISKMVCLSKSRLCHLFKDCVGISFKNYLLQKKFYKTWNYLAEGENITLACIHAGFSDSAHYANQMHKWFGLSTKRELMLLDNIYNVM